MNILQNNAFRSWIGVMGQADRSGMEMIFLVRVP